MKNRKTRWISATACRMLAIDKAAVPLLGLAGLLRQYAGEFGAQTLPNQKLWPTMVAISSNNYTDKKTPFVKKLGSK
ncbi:hypothetical protein R0I01_09365 [Bacillus pumilus]|nr:hypothetical protein R0I01_09365 [Bacillus pumilus]